MANFTFVTHKGARPEKSQLVKAHVMRESQRKRREARQNNHNRQQSSSSKISSKGTKTTHVELQCALYDAQSAVTEMCGKQTSTSTVDVENNPSASEHPRSTPEISTCISLPEDSTFFDWDEMCNDGLPQLAPSILGSNFGHTSNDSSGSLTPHISTLYHGLEGDNPSCDPTWGSQDLYNRVRELEDQCTSNIHFERFDTLTMSHAPYFHDTLLHEQDRDYLTNSSLHLSNQASGNTETCISDDDVAAVVSTSTYENIQVRNLAFKRPHDLYSMLNLSKRIDESSYGDDSDISEIATMQDMLHRSCSTVPPKMVDITKPILRDIVHASCSNVPPKTVDIIEPILRDVQRNHIEQWYSQSPLRMINDAVFERPVKKLQSSFSTLKDAFDAFEMLCVEAFDRETALCEAESFATRRAQYWTNLSFEKDTAFDDLPLFLEDKVEQAVHLAAKIHWRAVVLRKQHHEGVNEEDMKKLFVSLKAIDLKVWKEAPYVYLWILMTGGAAAKQHPDLQSYFLNEMLRIGFNVGLKDWLSFKQNMDNFLWMQQFLREQE